MRTKNYNFLLSICVIVLLMVSCYGFNPKKPISKKASATEKGFVVVELFTSEGCSSCPPADELVNKLSLENSQGVFILSYHVDYWDRLGWKDPFSKADFSQRQRKYAAVMLLEGVYTPQIVVNGTDQFVGSNEKSLRASIDKKAQPSDLTIEAAKENNSIHISYKISPNTSALLNIALVQTEASTFVRRGENEGKKLHHVNVVRELKTIETNVAAGKVAIDIPKELQGSLFKVIAYTQQKSDLKITGAAQAAIQ